LLLSRYGRLGASSRLRSFQYVDLLRSCGWEVDIAPLFTDAYIEALYNERSRWRHVISGYLRRLRVLCRSRAYNLIWLEKELFPYLPAWVEHCLSAMGIPYIADYDDPVFHLYDNHPNSLIRFALARKIDQVMRHAATIIAGNQYLAERAKSAGAQRVEVIPTVVDIERYPGANRGEHTRFTIGWIGSPTSSRFLSLIGPVFAWVTKNFDVRNVAVGARRSTVKGLPIEVQDWSEKTEVQAIQSFDIGIMPMPDEPWTRGKCGYKLIQYMACSLPVIASPIGVNKEIVDHGLNGFLAGDRRQWQQYLQTLIQNKEIRQEMGAEGRRRVETWYSLQVQAPRVEALMRESIHSNK